MKNSTNSSGSKVVTLTPEQVAILTSITENGNWILSPAPYCHFKAKKDNVSIAMYTSGKLVIQGAGTSDFVEFVLEPMVLKQASMPENDVPFAPHAGIDESGKGDFFGPLCIACVYVQDEATAQLLAKAGVQDSKAIKNDNKICAIAAEIRKIVNNQIGQVALGPEAYNRTYERIGNLNRLLAWGHARALENLLKIVPGCNDVLADKFGNEHLIKNALMTKGRNVTLRQQTKAEQDIAVAAASIIARADFVHRVQRLEEEFGTSLPKGAGTNVDQAAKALWLKNPAILPRVAKMHFRTMAKIDGSLNL